MLLAAGPALADPPAASTDAAGLIAEALADGVFEPALDDRMIAVRHPRSGLVCRLNPDNANRLMIFPRAARGEDVACESVGERASVTLYATRFSRPTDLDELMNVAEAAVRQRYPNAQPYAAADGVAADGILPPNRTLEFLVSRGDGARMYTRASIALLNGWAFKLRYTMLAPDEAALRQAEAASSLAWRAALGEIAAAPSS